MPGLLRAALAVEVARGRFCLFRLCSAARCCSLRSARSLVACPCTGPAQHHQPSASSPEAIKQRQCASASPQPNKTRCRLPIWDCHIARIGLLRKCSGAIYLPQLHSPWLMRFCLGFAAAPPRSVGGCPACCKFSGAFQCQSCHHPVPMKAATRSPKHCCYLQNVLGISCGSTAGHLAMPC